MTGIRHWQITRRGQVRRRIAARIEILERQEEGSRPLLIPWIRRVEGGEIASRVV
jgi:hypothetical protein